MAVLIEMPPEMETQVREAAEAEGVDVAAFLREAAAERLRMRARPSMALKDSELLQRITEGFPETFWHRYRVLVARREAGTLTPKEQHELIGYSDRTESRAADRLMDLAELSRRRGQPVKTLMNELGIRPVRLD